MFGALDGWVDYGSVEFCTAEGEENSVACRKSGVVGSNWRGTHLDGCLMKFEIVLMLF